MMIQNESDFVLSGARGPQLPQKPPTPSSTPLRPQFFLARPNGVFVPLIAADELPPSVVIRGVGKLLSNMELAASGMKSVGIVEPRHMKYVIESPKPTTPVTAVLASAPAPAPAPAQPAQSPRITSTLDFQLQPAPKGSSAKGPSAKGPSTIDDLRMSPSGVKEYCSYWIRHGECDYSQQGCLYRHEMPRDLPTLQSLGLRDLPLWYRQQNNLGSYLSRASPLSSGSSSAHWRGSALKSRRRASIRRNGGQPAGRAETKSSTQGNRASDPADQDRPTSVGADAPKRSLGPHSPRCAPRQRPTASGSGDLIEIGYTPSSASPTSTEMPSSGLFAAQARLDSGTCRQVQRNARELGRCCGAREDIEPTIPEWERE